MDFTMINWGYGKNNLGYGWHIWVIGRIIWVWWDIWVIGRIIWFMVGIFWVMVDIFGYGKADFGILTLIYIFL